MGSSPTLQPTYWLNSEVESSSDTRVVTSSNLVASTIYSYSLMDRTLDYESNGAGSTPAGSTKGRYLWKQIKHIIAHIVELELKRVLITVHIVKSL